MTRNTQQLRRLMILIHGAYGAGKSTLAFTAPGPRLILDSEGGAGFIEGKTLMWNPLTDGDHLPDGIDKDTSVIVDVIDWATYRATIDYVVACEHPFASVILDSYTEIQKQLKDVINPMAALGSYEKATYDVWDQLLVYMEKDIRKLRDLSRPSSKKPINVIIVAASNVEENPQRPILQGGLRRSLPGFMDVEGYLHVVSTVDAETGTSERRWKLDISPHDTCTAEVKCRPPQLTVKHGDSIWDPNITRMLRVVNPRTTTTANKKEQ